MHYQFSTDTDHAGGQRLRGIVGANLTTHGMLQCPRDLYADVTEHDLSMLYFDWAGLGWCK